VNLGVILQNAVDSLIQKFAESVFAPFLEAVADLFMSPQAIADLLFVDKIFASMRVCGIAILILIVTWQSFKAMFAWAGFESDEPIRIAVKAIVLGFLSWFSMDILMKGVVITNGFIKIIISAPFQGSYEFSVGAVILQFVTNITGLFVIESLFYIYIVFKCIGLLIKLFERYVLCGLLIAGSPLALVCGATEPTKGFLVGFMRLFVGNLVIQLLQYACLVAMFIIQMNVVHSFVKILLIIGLLKVCGKLEEIVRDMSITIGIGRSMGSMLQSVSSVVHVSQNIVNVAKSFVK
jgi:hypothetical protein